MALVATHKVLVAAEQHRAAVQQRKVLVAVVDEGSVGVGADDDNIVGDRLDVRRVDMVDSVGL